MAQSSADGLPTEESDATQPTPEKIRNAEEAHSPLSESTRVLLAELQNWQVVDPVYTSVADAENEPSVETEIEGEATLLSNGEPEYARAGDAPNNNPSEPDRAADSVDSVVIAGLPERQVVVKAGSASQLVVSLLNNGNQPADFDVHVEGWVRDGWMPEGKQRVAMQPGERNAVSLLFAPPHDPSALAGEFPLVIVVRSPQYARRVTRLHATLVIQPYTDFALGKLEDVPSSNGSQRSTLFTLPVTNRSNHPIAVQLHASTVGLACDAAWLDPKADPFQGMGPGMSSSKKGKASDGWRINPTVLTLATGETREIALRVKPRKAPIFGGKPVSASVRVTASVVGETRMPRSTTGEFRYAPPIKPWHLGLAAAASVLLLIMTVMGSLGAMLLFGNRPLVGSSAAPIVIILNQNAPVSAIQSVAKGVVPDASANPQSAESAPLLTADQITNPGEETATAQTQQGEAGAQALVITQPGQSQPAASTEFSAAPGGGAPMVSPADVSAPGSQPLVVTQPQPQTLQQTQPQPQFPATGGPTQEIVETPTASLTYGQMFQEIALQYDLDWRLLAAQAYVETGLDALALGSDGDMGLMQVLPSTWREWAPAVGAVDPFDAYSNTLVASAYLDYVRGELGKRGYPQAQWMLVGYNWGPDRLINFLDGGGTFEQLPSVRSQYATDILRIARTIP